MCSTIRHSTLEVLGTCSLTTVKLKVSTWNVLTPVQPFAQYGHWWGAPAELSFVRQSNGNQLIESESRSKWLMCDRGIFAASDWRALSKTTLEGENNSKLQECSVCFRALRNFRSFWIALEISWSSRIFLTILRFQRSFESQHSFDSELLEKLKRPAFEF